MNILLTLDKSGLVIDFVDFKQVKIVGYFIDFEQFKIDDYFVNFELMAILLTLNKLVVIC